MSKEVRIIKAKKDADNTVRIRVAAYCRVSTDSEDQANSFFAQVKYYNDYIRLNGDMILIDIYADEGISGAGIEKREDFKRLIQDVKKKKIDRVLVKSVTRFARNSLECIETVRLFKSYGVSVFFENENIDTERLNSEMILYLKSAFAQSELLSASRRMAVSVRMRMADGTYNLPSEPYGYRLENNELVIVPEEAKNVKKVFELFLSGLGGCLIARRMTENDKATEWTTRRVRYILSNERYIGDCLLQKSYTENTLPFRQKMNRGELPKYYYSGTHEPIIEKDVFFRVQDIIKQRCKRYYTPQYKTHDGEILYKRIYCRHCGRVCKAKTSSDGMRWVCSKQGLTEESCFSPIHSDEKVKSSFVSLFNILKQNQSKIIHVAVLELQTLKVKASGDKNEVADIDKELLSLTEQNRIYAELYSEHILDEVSYYEQTDKLKDKITELRSRRLKVLTDDEDEQSLESLRKLERIISGNDYISQFDETLFLSIIEKIFAEENGDLTFVFKCGLELKMPYNE